MQIKNRIFYVTGGASGLGEATVKHLVTEGALVAVLDLNEELGRKIEALLKETAIFVNCDVSSEEDVLKAIKAVDEKWGKKKVGGVVNCGGVGMIGKTVERDGTPFSLDTFRKVVEVNLIGTFNVSRLVASRLVQQYTSSETGSKPATEDQGVIIFVSSTSYQDGQMGQLAYAASKGGVASMALPMARDLARYGIRVVAIAPSLFTTAMGSNTPEKAKQALLRATEFPPRFGEADEFAHLVVSIIQNPMLNGTVIRLDGATRMGKL